MSVLRRKKAAQSQDRASCKDGVPKQRHITLPARKARQPSDNALMRGELRLRKLVLLRSQICLSLNLARMRPPYAATVNLGLR